VRVYFAAPLFSEAEKQYNEAVVELLEAEGHSVFLPQRDGLEGIDSLIRTEPDVADPADAMQKIFELDYGEVRNADVVTALLDGQIPDEGVAVEIGLAYAHDVPVVGLKTDIRVHAQDEPLKAMVFAALEELTESPDALLEAVSRYDPE
jgi:nucleoside 2-deoxyribosyltransferase